MDQSKCGHRFDLRDCDPGDGRGGPQFCRTTGWDDSSSLNCHCIEIRALAAPLPDTPDLVPSRNRAGDPNLAFGRCTQVTALRDGAPPCLTLGIAGSTLRRDIPDFAIARPEGRSRPSSTGYGRA